MAEVCICRHSNPETGQTPIKVYIFEKLRVQRFQWYAFQGCPANFVQIFGGLFFVVNFFLVLSEATKFSRKFIFQLSSQIMKNFYGEFLIFSALKNLYLITNNLIPPTKQLTIYKCEKCCSQKVASAVGGHFCQ